MLLAPTATNRSVLRQRPAWMPMSKSWRCKATAKTPALSFAQILAKLARTTKCTLGRFEDHNASTMLTRLSQKAIFQYTTRSWLSYCTCFEKEWTIKSSWWHVVTRHTAPLRALLQYILPERVTLASPAMSSSGSATSAPGAAANPSADGSLRTAAPAAGALAGRRSIRPSTTVARRQRHPLL